MPDSIPAYLINVVPELKVNDTVVMTGESMTLGEELAFTFTPEFAERYAIPNMYNVIAGSYVAVAVVGGNVSPNAIDNTKKKLQHTKTLLETDDPAQMGALTREDLFGDLFHAGLLDYYGQYRAAGYLLGLKKGGQHYLAAGLGTYGYEPTVDHLFGVPTEIRGGGVGMNLPIVNIYGYDSDGSATKKQDKVSYILQLGAISSMLEHAVPEKMFGTNEHPADAISAIKALSKASAAGQRIYQIDQQNQHAILPLLKHDQLVVDEIRNALAAGKEVITHTDAVDVPGWSGAGYIIFDPVTGDGAYKISGGENGGFLGFLLKANLVFLYFVAGIGLTVAAFLLFGLALLVGLAVIIGASAATIINFEASVLLFSIGSLIKASYDAVQQCESLTAAAISIGHLAKFLLDIAANDLRFSALMFFVDRFMPDASEAGCGGY